jgi:poly(A) polymerase Pap1
MKNNKKQKIINWICDEYINCIKKYDLKKDSWYYIIEKAFNLYGMSLPELKKFKKELLLK